ncbi:MAG: nitroreductase [Francisella sp.]|jgi:nitroreductase
MKVIEALKIRKSVRKFKDKAIEKDTLKELFEAAKWTASSKNTQPWKVAVVSGQKKIDLTQKLLQEVENGKKPRMEYDYDGGKLEGEMKQRAIECGQALYGALNIGRDDKEKRIEQWKQNYISFDSPTVIFIFKNKDAGLSSYMDCGMLIQSIMLTATDLGLATCSQASLGQYPDIVKKEVGFDEYTLVCGMAIGYEDTQAPVNNYRTARQEVSDFVKFI